MKRKPRQPAYTRRYTLMDEITASATEPLPKAWRDYQVGQMREGLEGMATAAEPTTKHWSLCSDVVNLMEMLVELGEVQDPDGLLQNAITGLAEAGERHRQGKSLRMSGQGLVAVRAVLRDYEEVLPLLSARTMIRCHRKTEQRLHEVLAGKRLPQDVEVFAG